MQQQQQDSRAVVAGCAREGYLQDGCHGVPLSSRSGTSVPRRPSHHGPTENAGLENAAPNCRGGKCGTKKVWKANQHACC